MPHHKDLTGTDLHEPKGAATASANTIYVATGAGSGTWKKVGSTEIDTTTVLNLNKFKVTLYTDDIGTAETFLVPLTSNATLTKATFILNGAITLANSTVSLYKNSATLIGTQTITYTASGEGTTFTFTPSSNNTFTAGEYIKLVNDGAATGPQKATIVLDFNYT